MRHARVSNYFFLMFSRWTNHASLYQYGYEIWRDAIHTPVPAVASLLCCQHPSCFSAGFIFPSDLENSGEFNGRRLFSSRTHVSLPCMKSIYVESRYGTFIPPPPPEPPPFLYKTLKLVDQQEIIYDATVQFVRLVSGQGQTAVQLYVFGWAGQRSVRSGQAVKIVIVIDVICVTHIGIRWWTVHLKNEYDVWLTSSEYPRTESFIRTRSEVVPTMNP